MLAEIFNAFWSSIMLVLQKLALNYASWQPWVKNFVVAFSPDSFCSQAFPRDGATVDNAKSSKAVQIEYSNLFTNIFALNKTF